MHDVLGITPAHARRMRREHGDGGEVDIGLLFRTLDAKRRGEGLSWRRVASLIGISASTITRLQDGRSPDLDGFASCVRWLRCSADTFLIGLNKLELSIPQRRWLRYAFKRGYEQGFRRAPTEPLLALERAGFIERDPTSRGDFTNWRITESGSLQPEAIEQAARRKKKVSSPSARKAVFTPATY